MPGCEGKTYTLGLETGAEPSSGSCACRFTQRVCESPFAYVSAVPPPPESCLSGMWADAMWEAAVSAPLPGNCSLVIWVPNNSRSLPQPSILRSAPFQRGIVFSFCVGNSVAMPSDLQRQGVPSERAASSSSCAGPATPPWGCVRIGLSTPKAPQYS